jgi:hypothetical protein
MFLTTTLWWLWDGLRLLRGKVATSGERLVTRDEFDEDTASSAQLQPPTHWRKYKTPAGHDYYYDPATERIHYLSATGSNNYAIDPMLNHAVAYNSLHELEIKLAPGYAEGGEAGSDEEEAELATEPDESAPLSPRSREAGTEAARPKGFKKSVQAVVAGKRVRVAAGGDTGDECPSRSAGGPDEQTL